MKSERDLGISDGMIDSEDFGYLYMYLEFGDGKKVKKPKK
jgi:hypothetical protein